MQNNHINYIEFKSGDLVAVKSFYSEIFGWKFVDYGSTYTAFENSGLQGGFEYSEEEIVNGALIVLYHDDLESIHDKLMTYGTEIIVPIFSFPGGRRFHFRDPSGNELAIWSDK